MLIDISYFTLLYSKIVVINYICICFADFKKKCIWKTVLQRQKLH